MANTYVKIAEVSVGAGGQASIEFTSIPSTYTDLCLKISARTNNTGPAGEALVFTFNGSSANRTNRRLYGQGTGTIGSTNGTTMYAGMASNNGQTSTTFGNSEIYIPNYAGSTNKSSSSDGVSENNGSWNQMQMDANLWSSTAAINQITITGESGGSFLQYSTAYLYGISKS